MREIAMRKGILLIGLIGLVHCSPAPAIRSQQPPSPKVIPPHDSPPAGIPRVATTPPRATHTNASGITFDGITFDARSHRLRVIDQPKGPGSEFADAASVIQTHGALAACNAGFFTPEGEPLGLVVSHGQARGAWNGHNALGSGLFCEHPNGTLQITRRESLGASQARQSRELIQAGPLLVENHQAVKGLEATKSRVRTLVLWDGGNRWWLGLSSPCTLAQAASTLSQVSPAG